MRPRRTPAAEAASPHRESDWILVFAGVTPAGMRRAVSVVRWAEQRALGVVLFTAFPLDFPTERPASSPDLSVVDYSEEEKSTITARLATFSPASRSAWSRIVRGIGKLMRGYAGWNLISPSVRQLRAGPDPCAILFCDDFAIVPAWHAARVWPNVPVQDALRPLSCA